MAKIKPFHVIGRAIQSWWNEWTGMVFLNMLWVLFQFPIITGPPATAVMYAICQKVYDKELWGWEDLWPQLRPLFWPAWKWAGLNLLIAAIFGVNFYAYWDSTWTGFAILRITWLMLAIFWITLNFFYWPFYHAQDDKSMRTTYVNCMRFILIQPGAVLILVIASALIFAASILTTLPFLIMMAVLLALIGTTAVGSSLELQQKKA